MTKKGFTLIEVMVVAVIVAILSAVAIPIYNGYIERSANDVSKNVAGVVASSVGLAIENSSSGYIAMGTIGAVGGILQIATEVSVVIPKDVSVSYGGGDVTASHIKGSGIVTVNY